MTTDNSIDLILDTVRDWLSTAPPFAHLYVALSGGVDSVVLLHALKTVCLEQVIGLSAIHVNHQLQSQAKSFALYCQAYCEMLGVSYLEETVNATPPPKESPEAYARACRYEVLRQYVHANACLITAHHQSDQAETWLLQSMRGAGPKGLSCMPTLKPFGKGFLGRPLLTVSREALLAYAKQYALSWIEDPTNAQVDYLRNFVRHQVMPLLRARNPGVDKAFARAAMHCAHAEQLLQELASLDRKKADLPDGALCCVYLKTVSPLRQANCVRHWLAEKGVMMPPEARLMTFLHQLRTAAPDRHPQLRWGDYAIEVRKKAIRFVNIPNKLQNACI